MNKKQNDFCDLDVLILCGGYGTRVKKILGKTPKSMAIINQLPFLDLLINQLKKNGINKAIFCVGYQSREIIKYYKDRKDFKCIFSEERAALGTGGAIKNATKHIKSDRFFVLNGDSICDVNFRDFYLQHLAKNAFVSIAVVRSRKQHSKDYGAIFIDDNYNIKLFQEKKMLTSLSEEIRYANAGVYLFDREILDYFYKKPNNFSLEHDVFPEIIATQNCFGFILKSEFYDIGTQKRLLDANKKLINFFT